MRTKRRIIIICFVAFMFLFSGTFLYMSKIYEKDFVEENKVSDGANLNPILYYRWKLIGYSTVTLNSNGSTAKTSVIYNVSYKSLERVYGEMWQLLSDIGREWFNTNGTTSWNPFASPISVPTRTSYKFLGYYTSSSGGTQTIDSSGKIIASVDTYKTNATWYAHWEYYPTNFTLTFDRQGGTGGTSSIQAVLGQSVPTITPPTRTGYNFVGYFSEQNGKGTQYYSSSGTALAPWGNQYSATLYAHWEGKPYTVVYHPDYSGASASSHTGFKYGTSIALRSISALGYNRSGYTFLGWATSSGGGVAYTNGQNVNYLSSNGGTVNLYAVWQANTYSVRFNSNFLPASSSSQSGFTYDSPMALKKNTFVRSGYKFLGWSTSTTGGVVYSDGESVSTLTTIDGNTVDLYAVWQANIYMVTAEANSGSIPSTSGWSGSGDNATKTITFNSTYGTLPAPTKTGYNFTGWYTAANGGNLITSSTTVTTAGNHTIYAHWSPQTFYVNFYANGGSGSMSSMSVTYDRDPMQLTSNAFKKENYIFKYWSTNSSGTGVKYYEKQYVSNLTSALNLYAVWEESWNAHASQSLIGSGKINDPFLVSSAADLAYISKAVDNGTSFSSVQFKQTGNIDLAKDNNGAVVSWLWMPIGAESSKAFQGNYDGNGFLIKNLTTSTARVGSPSGNYLYSNVGLFGYTKNATIKNVNIISGAVRGYDNVGSIVGNLNYGSIQNCRSGASVTGHFNIGMIGSAVSSSILSSYNYGNINGNNYAGGIVGSNSGGKSTIANCFARCNVYGAKIGGILGQSNVSGTEVIACGFKGDITNSNQGLIAGSMTSGIIRDCIAITSTQNISICAGGATVQNCIYDNGIQNKIGNDFSNWSELASGLPLPKGLAWIGGFGYGLK